MYEKIDDIGGNLATYETEQSADQVLDRAFQWRKGTDTDVLQTAMRAGYYEPLKGRIGYETLKCSDGSELYRLTIDGKPILYDDEEEYGGWMTYHQLLCFLEGYNRLCGNDHFV